MNEEATESITKLPEKKMLRQLSTHSFYQVISKELKNDHDGNGFSCIKVIDELMNQNQRLYL
jgi:hypothetical protein